MHLPANARGVLYLSEARVEAHSNYQRIFVDSIPEVPQAQAFSITENGNQAHQLEPFITHLDVAQQLGKSEYFLVKSQPLRDCLQIGMDDGCRSSDVARFEQLVASGQVKDVSSTYLEADGLFRIAPAGGFEQGNTYTIRHADGKDSSEYASEIRVEIDAPIAVATPGSIKLDVLGAATRELTDAVGGDCRPTSASLSTVQNLKYTIPEQYSRYRDSIQFITQRKVEPGPGATSSRYLSLRAEVYPFKSGYIGRSLADEEVIKYMCFAGAKRERESESVRGLVGFLEVDDIFFETPTVNVSYAPAKRIACTTDGILQNAIAGKSVQKIRQQMCLAGNVDANISGDDEPRPALFELLVKAASSADVETQACAQSSLSEVLGKYRTLDPKKYQIVLRLISKRLGSADPAVRYAALYNLTRLPRPDHRLRASFAPLVPDLRKALATSSYWEKREVIELLAFVGSGAKAAVPALIEEFRNNTFFRLETVRALVAIAPADLRVENVLLDMLTSSGLIEREIGMETLLSLEKDRPDVVISTLAQAVVRGNEDAIGELRKLRPPKK